MVPKPPNRVVHVSNFLVPLGVFGLLGYKELLLIL